MRFLMVLALLGTAAAASAQFSPETAGGILAQLRPPASYLGVRIGDVDAERAKKANLSEERGVEVASVEDDSPASAAGIKPGDILTSYNGENILGAQQFIRLVGETPAGRRVKIQLWRNNKTQSVLVTTASSRTASIPLPANLTRFDFPDVRTFELTDVPDPVLVWRNQMLGMECEPLNQQLAQFFGVKGGVLVRSVQSGSPAEAAGVRAGDVISAIAGQPLLNPQDIGSCLRSHATGENIALTVTREHKLLMLKVKPPSGREPSR